MVKTKLLIFTLVCGLTMGAPALVTADGFKGDTTNEVGFYGAYSYPDDQVAHGLGDENNTVFKPKDRINPYYQAANTLAGKQPVLPDTGDFTGLQKFGVPVTLVGLSLILLATHVHRRKSF
ncbi:MAG: hypothetical protein LBT80_00115 [Lactobacillaceae bacterium]|nr:hypothetical protein [Lactobacillaceae bacterium]